MSCNCIERLEELLTEKMKEKFPDGEIVNPVEFQNKTFVFNETKTSMILANPTIGRIKLKGRIKKYDVNMFPLYCPYCGKPLKEEE